jgi:tripartite ATP-independent transporter DctM subunit
MTLVLAIVFVVALLLSVPVAFSLGIAGIAAILADPGARLLVVPQRLFAGLDSFAIVSIPLFILAGELIFTSGMGARLVALGDKLVGHFWGGLASVSTVTSMLMAGVSGSSVADASSVGRVLIPEMVKRGYGARFAAAVNSATSTVGIIIPPSIPIIVYAILSGVSIRDLFAAALLPGVLAGAAMLLTGTIIAYVNRYPRGDRPTARELLREIGRNAFGLGLPALVLGGIFTGAFTPTEAASVAVMYALLIGFVNRELTFTKLTRAFINAAITSSIILLIIATSSLLAWLLTFDFVPQQVSAFVRATFDQPIVYLLFIAALLLVIGTIIDVIPAMIMFVPIFLPTTTALGIEPLQFGVMVVFTLAIGLFTPPVGTCLYVSCYIAQTPILRTALVALPYLAAMLLILLLVIFVPAVTTWVPSLLY